MKDVSWLVEPLRSVSYYKAKKQELLKAWNEPKGNEGNSYRTNPNNMKNHQENLDEVVGLIKKAFEQGILED